MDNKQKVRKRIEEMIKDSDFKETLDKEIDRELSQVYITEEQTENYALAKKILYKSLKGLAWQYKPLDDLSFP